MSRFVPFSASSFVLGSLERVLEEIHRGRVVTVCPVFSSRGESQGSRCHGLSLFECRLCIQGVEIGFLIIFLENVMSRLFTLLDLQY